MIYLVDISSFIFRAFYAVRPLTSPKGIPTNAVYGVFSMLLKFLKEEKPEYIAVCYDRPEPSFRKDIYSEYKANRSSMPEDLIPQMDIIKNLISNLGIPSIEKAGFEADDLIGTITRKALNQKMKVVILSGDKDFSQLLVEGVVMHDTMKNSKTMAADVFAKYGVHVSQFIDYLAIMGDSSDNIPGVSGIGPKGAQKLLSQFSSLEEIYKNIESVKPDSIKQKLIHDKQQAFTSKVLVTIDQNVPMNLEISDFKRKPISMDSTLNQLSELNFKTFEKALKEIDLNLSEPQSSVIPKPDNDVRTVSVKFPVNKITPGEIEKSITKNSPTWISLNGDQFYLLQSQTIFQIDRISESVRALNDLQLNFLGFGVKEILREIGLSKVKIVWDSQIAAYVLKPGENLSFESVCLKYLGSALEIGDESANFDFQIQLKEILLRELVKANQLSVFEQLDMPLADVLFKMEHSGIKIDLEILKKQSNEIGTILQEIEKKTADYSNGNVNLNSPKQLQVLLFETLKLTPSKKTKTGYSTDSDVLEKLKDDHPIIPMLLEYRELSKLKSTYLDSLPMLVGEDHRLHTHFNQVLTATGRLSSIDPNLQNIPIRTERGAQVRKAFIADNGLALGSVDYSQIELRILAHYSEDVQLCEAFINDLDVHTATAAEIFSVSIKDVTSQQRRAAKAVNFGIAYGQGVFGLSEALGISRTEASDIINKYFGRFPGVREYIENMITKAKEKGFVETLFGRRRYIDELKSSNNNIVKFGERAAINAPIQGTAADLMKKGMIKIAETISLPMILQIHDELLFEGTVAELKKYEPLICSTLESIVQLKVPLKVNFSIGSNWGEAH